jgi:hypothetical protein
MKQWDEWIDEISSQDKLCGGNQLSKDGRVLKSGDKINGGPYVAKKESVAGYIIIKSNSIDEAVSIAKRCPILNGKGTSVEVREIEEM